MLHIFLWTKACMRLSCDAALHACCCNSALACRSFIGTLPRPCTSTRAAPGKQFSLTSQCTTTPSYIDMMYPPVSTMHVLRHILKVADTECSVQYYNQPNMQTQGSHPRSGSCTAPDSRGSLSCPAAPGGAWCRPPVFGRWSSRRSTPRAAHCCRTPPARHVLMCEWEFTGRSANAP